MIIKPFELEKKVLKVCIDHLTKEKYKDIVLNKEIKECGCIVQISATKKRQNYVFNFRNDASPLFGDTLDEIQKLQEEGYNYIILLPDKIKIPKKYIQNLRELNIGLFHVGEKVKIENLPEIIKPDVHKIKVFIASAGRLPIRQQVTNILRGREFWMFVPDCYEWWAGSSGSPEETSIKKVDENDILLGILEEEIKKIFVKEVKYAKKTDKPIVLLVRDPCPKRKKEAKDFLKKMEEKVVHLPFNNKNLKDMIKCGLTRAVKEGMS